MHVDNNIEFIEGFEKSILTRLSALSESLSHEKISFSKVISSVNCDDSTEVRHYFLSMVLAGEFSESNMNSDWELITELVIDVTVKSTDGVVTISVDLSYDNGILKKEIILDNASSDLKTLMVELDEQFFNSVEYEINKCLNDLIR
jgi:hypothetical protein